VFPATESDETGCAQRAERILSRSCNILTARSRTDGENLLDLFRAQSSQSVEPPQIPGRFIQALRAGKSGKAGFADFLITQVALREGCSAVVSFDRAAVRYAGMTLVE